MLVKISIFGIKNSGAPEHMIMETGNKRLLVDQLQ